MPCKNLKSQQSETVTVDLPSLQSLGVQQHLTSTGRRYKDLTVFFGFGVTEVTIGALSVLLGLIAAILSSIAKDDTAGVDYYVYCDGAKIFSSIGQGIWCGLLLVATGVLGIKLTKRPSRGVYIANMVMTIITPITMSVGVIMSSIGAASSTSCSQALVGLHAIIAVSSLIAMVITIIHGAFSCNGVCCNEQPVIILTTSQQASNMVLQDSSASTY